MGARLTFMLVVSFLVGVSVFASPGNESTYLYDRILLPGEVRDDMPLRSRETGPRADTTWYGQYEIIGGEHYAVAFDNKIDGRWTFDRGTGPLAPPPPLIDNGEGWSAYDLTMNQHTFFRVIDETLDLGPDVPAPIIAGERSLWVGIGKEDSDTLCYECGAGYGNDWHQRCTSPALPYNGSADVTLSFLYFCQAEPCYDDVLIYLKRSDETDLELNPYPAGTCQNNLAFEGGTFTDSIGHYSDPATYARVITAAEIGGAQDIRIIFDFTSDGGWSDEDCDYRTTWGPFGVDNISITGGGIDVAYDFEDGLQGWTPAPFPGEGGLAGIADVGAYTIQDNCSCGLEGNILEMHEGIGDDGTHPVFELDQLDRVVSPICDLGGAGVRTIFMEFDIYAELPLQEGVLFRPGWIYYPYECNGCTIWSPRVGQSRWEYVGDYPVCERRRYCGTDLDVTTPIPPDAQMVCAVIELLSDCEAISEWCLGYTNFTPLFDNISVGVLPAPDAPPIAFDDGTRYQDVGSYPSGLFDPMAPGPANVALNKNMEIPDARDLCGDTLVVTGPEPSYDPNTRWEARLWWRVARRAPFQADSENGAESRYKTWRDRVSDGHLIDRPDRPEFAWAWMDSAQPGYLSIRNKFRSEFREDDDDFVGEGNPENEIIWDDVLYPGSRIEYFITSNYTATPNELYYLPDTTGRFFCEFEVLPGLRTVHVPDCGGTGRDFCVFQPAALYIDAYGRGAQLFIENALQTVLNGRDACTSPYGCRIPKDRAWDRYDYDDACSSWNSPFMRGSLAGSNNGMTLNQILGYRTILVNTGSFTAGTMHDRDFLLFGQWLSSPECGAGVNRQVFVINGDGCGEVLENPGGAANQYGIDFLNNTLGATLVCDAFNGTEGDPECGEISTSYCVRLLPVDGGAYDTDSDVDAYGNYCPNVYGFNTYAPTSGTGNRSYYAEDDAKVMDFAQITNEDLGADANFRTVLDGVSWHHMTRRDPGGQGLDLCPRDLPSVVAAGIAEIGAALKWGFDVEDHSSIPKWSGAEALANCQNTWETIPSGIDGRTALHVDRLYPNEPNPFGGSTTIRFSLARAGKVEVAIYDISGRLVKTLVDGKEDAGLHTVIWDGTTEAGRPASSGIYWSRMKTGTYISNRKMVELR